MSPFRLFRWAAGPGIKHVRAEIFGQTAMKRSLLRPNWKRLFNKWNGLCFTGQVSSLTCLRRAGSGLARTRSSMGLTEQVPTRPCHEASLWAETWEKILQHTENRSWHKVCFNFLGCRASLVVFWGLSCICSVAVMYVCFKVLVRRYISIFPLTFLCNIFSSSSLDPCGNKKCIFLDEATVQAEPFCS